MPSWKKVIISGSNAVINDITLSGDISLAPTNKIQFDGDGGHTYIDEQSDDNLRFRVGAQNMMIMVEGDTDYVRVPDSVRLSVGSSNDLQMVHDGTNSFILNNTNDLTISNLADDKDIILKSDDGSGGTTAYITLDGSTTTVEVAKNLNVSANISGSQIEASGDVIAFGSSDERLKDNITYIHKPLAKINKIGGYKFTWNDKQDTYLGKDVGVLAQEIEAVLPELVTTRATGYKAVKYEKIVPLLIEGIKELDKKIKHIEKNCDCLNN